MNLINERNPRTVCYSDLKPLVAELGDAVLQYFWIFDENDLSATLPVETKRGDSWLLSGEQMQVFASDFPLFDWLILSAVPINRAKSILFESSRPYADGNPNFWKGRPVPQLSCAEFEIVCWDSSATLLIGAPAFVANAFQKVYPGCFDLDEANINRYSKSGGFFRTLFDR